MSEQMIEHIHINVGNKRTTVACVLFQTSKEYCLRAVLDKQGVLLACCFRPARSTACVLF